MYAHAGTGSPFVNANLHQTTDRLHGNEGRGAADDRPVIKPLKIPFTNAQKRQSPTAPGTMAQSKQDQQLAEPPGQNQGEREVTETTESPLMMSRRELDNYQSVSSTRHKKHMKSKQNAQAHSGTKTYKTSAGRKVVLERSMNLDDLLFAQDNMTVREHLYNNSHRGAGSGVKLKLSFLEREELVKMFQRSQMEQNAYKVACMTLENPLKMR